MRRALAHRRMVGSVRGRNIERADLPGAVMRHVAARAAVSLGMRREAGLIAFYLGVCLRQKIDTTHVGELNQVYKHVGSFIGDPGTRSGILQVTTDFRVVNPLQFRSKLAHFCSQGQRQVTDRVPSPPATRRCEPTQTVAEDIELARHGQIVARRGMRLDSNPDDDRPKDNATKDISLGRGQPGPHNKIATGRQLLSAPARPGRDRRLAKLMADRPHHRARHRCLVGLGRKPVLARRRPLLTRRDRGADASRSPRH
jgi:hypothetical protein